MPKLSLQIKSNTSASTVNDELTANDQSCHVNSDCTEVQKWNYTMCIE